VMKRAHRHDPAAQRPAALRLALVHAEHQHPRAADRERLHLQTPTASTRSCRSSTRRTARSSWNCPRSRLATARCFGHPMASMATRITGSRPGRPIFERTLLGEQPGAPKYIPFHDGIPTSSDGRAVRSRCAASSSHEGSRQSLVPNRIGARRVLPSTTCSQGECQSCAPRLAKPRHNAQLPALLCALTIHGVIRRICSDHAV